MALTSVQGLSEDATAPIRPFSIVQPKKLAFGRGCLSECIGYVAELRPDHLHILTSRSLRSHATHIADELRAVGITVSVDSEITSEPTISVFATATECARNAGATCIIGLGGGSVLDVAKLVAAFIRSDQKLEEAFGI